MVYKVIGLMSGSSLDGIDIILAELDEAGGKWSYNILNVACHEYSREWIEKLSSATHLNALDYQLLHSEYGHYLGQTVNSFIRDNQLDHQVHFIASHGHTTFHIPEKRMTHQLGDGAAIAAETRLPVISDLRSLDVAFGGQGAPIVPIGEMYLFREYNYFLNIGGIANISFIKNDQRIGYDVCPANKVLNLLANNAGKLFDENGAMAASGKVHEGLLEKLNALPYYQRSFPKSLPNSFGTDIIYPMIKNAVLSIPDALSTYTAHIAFQIAEAIKKNNETNYEQSLLVTGGGAFNTFLISCLSNNLNNSGITVLLPSPEVIQYKEALIMALMGALRWREQSNVLHTVTGSSTDSIGGALWLGGQA